MKKIIFIVFAVAAVLLLLPLSFNNSQTAEVNYLLGKLQLPLSHLVIYTFIAGVVVSLPFFAVTGWGWKMRARSLQKQIDELLKQRKRDDIAKQFKDEKNSA